ncbi:MAG TPA: universal stress protein [Thermomicrobiales bacterium]|nr:universal stress protein [Thermomicrobiales bacterium]
MYDRILVPLDGSELASTALVHAKELAKQLDAPLHLIRAIDPTVVNRVGTVGMGFDYTAIDELLTEEEQDATAYIDSQVNTLNADGLTTTGVVLRGYAAAAIDSVAKEGDVIVMASHGRTGVRRWFLGSVAEEVLRQSQVPVLLIRQSHDGEK